MKIRKMTGDHWGRRAMVGSGGRAWLWDVTVGSHFIDTLVIPTLFFYWPDSLAILIGLEIGM